MTNRLPLLNAEFKLPEDGYVQFAPFGEWPGVAEIERPNGTVERRAISQVIDPAAAAAILAKFRAESAKPGFRGLFMDFDHTSLQKDGSTLASGWIMDMQQRADGIYAKVRWSKSGLDAVTGGDYLYPSPVFPWDNATDLGKTANGLPRVRLNAIVGGALTNDPGLIGISAVANRRRQSANPDPLNPEPTIARKEPARMNRIANRLKLADTATEDELLAALGPTLARLDALEVQAAGIQADADLKPFEGLIANRDQVRQILITNRDQGLKLLAALKPAPAPTTVTTTAAATSLVPNRRSAADPGKAEGEADPDAAAVKRAAIIRNRAAEIRKTQRVTRARAWELAAAENPEEGK